MIHSERPLGLLDGFVPERQATREGPTIRTTVLLAALLFYVLGFVALYPLVQASVAKSVAEGNDPALLDFVGP